MLVFYSGEDEVTKLVAKKLIGYCWSKISEESLQLEDANPRAYGTKALESIPKLVKLGESAPTIGIFDSDGDCIKTLLNQYSPSGWKTQFVAINFAIDEAENWLVADRNGFSKFFQTKINCIPEKETHSDEILFPYKTSTYILLNIIPTSRSARVKSVLRCPAPNKKPATYNSVWPAFIDTHWDIECACNNSQTLRRSINRISNALMQYDSYEE